MREPDDHRRCTGDALTDLMPIALNTALTDIAHVIQLAIAPVFLLNAVGAMIGVLAARLARIVDRMRVLEESDPNAARRDPAVVREELTVLERRMTLIYVAMGLDVTCALFVGSVIVVAFGDAFLRADLAAVVAVLFVGAMLAFISSLLVFLREIFLAVRRFPHRRAEILGGERT